MLSTPGARIGGGTEEIVRNTVAEKVLGLPKEPRADGGYQTRSTSSPASVTWLRTAAFATLPVAVFGSSSVT